MSNWKYNDKEHYYNVCNKYLKNRGILLTGEKKQNFLALTIQFYYLSERNQTAIKQHQLKDTKSVLTYELNLVEPETYDEFLVRMSEIADFYSGLFCGEPMNATYVAAMKTMYFSPQTQTTFYDKDNQTQRSYSEYFIQEQLDLIHKCGVYALFNEKDELIYIGKSTRNLGSRLASSVRERAAAKYSYAVTSSVSDANVYEMYYIATLKPPLNRDSVTDDLPSVILPDLNFTKIRPTYADLTENEEQPAV